MKKHLVVPSLLYFTLFAVNASAGRFISLFFLDYGLTDAEVGFLLGCGTLTSLIFKPIVGYLADVHGSKIVMLYGSAISCAIFLLNTFSLTFKGSHRMYFLTALWCIRSPFNVTSILDAFTVKHLAESKDDGNGDLSSLSEEDAEEVKSSRTSAYGMCRLWGAVSWAITNLALGAFMDHFGSSNVMIISSTASTLLFTILVLWAIPSGRRAVDGVQPDKSNIEMTKKIGADAFSGFLGALFRSPYALAFFFVTFCQGAGSALVEGMVFLYFREHLHSSNLLCGISVVVTVMFEIPLFAVSSTVLKEIGIDTLKCPWFAYLHREEIT